MKTLYVLGSINTDLSITTPRMPKAGETISGNDFLIAQGGKGANQAVAASRSGARVIMCGAVGDDIFGKNSLESLRSENIDTSFIKILKDTPSGTATIVLCEKDNRIILNSGANSCVNSSDIDAFLSSAKPGDIFLTQLENPVDVVGYALKKAKEKEMITILNPAPATKEIIPFIPYSDLFIPNETECELLGGENELIQQCKTLIVTLGDKGYLIRNKENRTNYPCMKIDPVDTTSAGDTFCGYLASLLCKGEELPNACKIASVAASIACTKRGAQPSIPKLDEVMNAIDK